MPPRTPAGPGTHGGGMPGNPAPTPRRQHLARVSPSTQPLSDRYLSASGPRGAENHTHHGLSGTLGPETGIQS